MLYDTALLRTFVAICDAGSFTKAAREVNLTQSAVSLHVKRLEEQVGSRLIPACLKADSLGIPADGER
jgi:DNA-binding transcriptional LysR family regulator